MELDAGPSSPLLSGLPEPPSSPPFLANDPPDDLPTFSSGQIFADDSFDSSFLSDGSHFPSRRGPMDSKSRVQKLQSSTFGGNSSDPPVFSSEDNPRSADVGNYNTPRNRRKRAGPWWETDKDAHSGAEEEKRGVKKSKFSRNMDSGIWMNSDDNSTDGTEEGFAGPSNVPGLLDEENPPQPPQKYMPPHRYSDPRNTDPMPIFSGTTFGGTYGMHRLNNCSRSYDKEVDRLDQTIVDKNLDAMLSGSALVRTMDLDMRSAGRMFYDVVKKGVGENRIVYHLDNCNLEDGDIRCIDMLNHVIREPLDPGKETPGEEYYASLEPELYVDLYKNCLVHLVPQLFSVQHLTHLILRHNEIDELSPQIAQLKNLKTLDVSHNYLQWLPFEVTSLLYDSKEPERSGKLEFLNTMGNPLVLAPRNRGHLLNPRGVAFWPPTYYDEDGLILPGSPAPMTSMETHSPALERPSTGNFSGSPPFFTPPARGCVRSLASLCMDKALTVATPSHIKEMTGPDMPLCLERVIRIATDNAVTVFDTFRHCHVCGKRYLVVRAEWFEFWPGPVMFPVRRMVCSWACVPDKYARLV